MTWSPYEVNKQLGDKIFSLKHVKSFIRPFNGNFSYWYCWNVLLTGGLRGFKTLWDKAKFS